jgi:hypothetical protein
MTKDNKTSQKEMKLLLTRKRRIEHEIASRLTGPRNRFSAHLYIPSKLNRRRSSERALVKKQEKEEAEAEEEKQNEKQKKLTKKKKKQTKNNATASKA